MVDFVIALMPDEQMAQSFSRIKPLDGATTKSFNQTTHHALLSMPITVNIATKRVGGNSEDATMQLTIWAVAQFSRLKRLVKKAGHVDAQMPVLPLLVAQGAMWFFLAATQEGDQTVRINISMSYLGFLVRGAD